MAAIPPSTKVLVIGGGPAGSYAAAALAREGIDVVVLEADRHPRYHVGESALPSMPKYLGFIGCEAKFEAHGFIRKNGAGFKINSSKPVVYTDFLRDGGPENYAWNLVRSEADAILFGHAAECGAQTFEGVKVESIQFAGSASGGGGGGGGPGPRPVSASWRRTEKTGDDVRDKGTVHFDYLIDASGRHGLLSTRYLRNRTFNGNLKNVASWGYWRDGVVYGAGTAREGYAFIEALRDGQGWAWYIPLHNGTHSVGVVQKLEAATARKRAWGGGLSPRDFYLRCLEAMAPEIMHRLLAHATPVGPDATGAPAPGDGDLAAIHTASDWSYSASAYALPHARIVGDAGCFVDPFFSSGMHVALTTALSAAVTVAASIRGDCSEDAAAAWHDKRVAETYTRFFLVVSASTKQIGAQDHPVLAGVHEDGFERAFEHFRPVIQGTVDAAARHDNTGTRKFSQAEIARTVEFCLKCFTDDVKPEQRRLMLQKLQAKQANGDDHGDDHDHDDDDHDDRTRILAEVVNKLTPDDLAVFDMLQGHNALRKALYDDAAVFSLDAIDLLAPRLERARLGLRRVDELTEKKMRQGAFAVRMLDGMAAE